ncbi:MAG: MerC domain-containing protein [Bacteroidota bacterium]
MTAPAQRLRLDAAGITVSVLCLIHCLALPLIATGALAWLVSERVHVGLVMILSLVVIGVAGPGYRRHRRALVPALLGVGLVFLVAALVLGEPMGEHVETGGTVIGTGCLIVGHFLNLTLPSAQS